ncbi:DUF1566 domain-containing protein [Leptospira sp. WS60.C2]
MHLITLNQFRFIILLFLFLTCFSHCSPLYYYLLQTPQENEKPYLTQILTTLLVGGNLVTQTGGGIGVPVIYPWGTFTDQNNGTVLFQGNAGTFGGQVYSTSTLIFPKCASGQTWEQGTNTCTPTLPPTFRYCSANDNSCNDAGTLLLNGTGISEIWTECTTLTLAGRTWRPATKNEMKLTLFCADTPTTISIDNGASCGSVGRKINTTLFPYDLTKQLRYWTSSAVNATTGWYINYGTGTAISGDSKNVFNYVRCISDGP